jgi:hypothetical protein
MQRIECELPRNFEFVFLSDTHGGSQLTHYDGIVKIIDYIASRKNCYWGHGGDWIEAVTTDDKRYNSDHYANKDENGKPKNTPIPMKQAKEMIQMFKPIKKKGIYGLGGNHELKLHRFGNLAEEICDDLGIPYGTRTARIVFNHKGQCMFKAFVTHDVPMLRSNAKDYIQQQANIQAALKQSLYKRMGDCAVMIAAHIHQLIVIPPTPQLYLVDSPDGVKQNYLTSDMGSEGQYIDYDRRWYGCSGSTRKRFVDGIDDYSDIYAPNELGCLIMYVQDGAIQDIRKMKV